MLYRALADLVVVIHLAFIAFAVLGGTLTLCWRWVTWLHLPAAVWAAAVEFLGWYCPLTPLENSLRQAAGGAAYPGGFVEHYLIPLLYPADLAREMQFVLGCGVVGVNAAIYFAVWRRARSLA